MAATNGVLEAGPFLLYREGVAVAYLTSVSFQSSHQPREIKNKTDGRWPRRKLGRLDVTGSANCLYAILSDAGVAIYNLEDAYDDMIAGTVVTLLMSNANSGDRSIGGDALMTGVNITFGDYGENATGDFSFACDGAWAFAAIS